VIHSHVVEESTLLATVGVAMDGNPFDRDRDG
jgi:hypothetical protein